jgi:hypothetical protein
MLAAIALGRGVLAGAEVSAVETPGVIIPPTVPDGTTFFIYDAQVAARPLAMAGLAGAGPQNIYPGGGIILVPDPAHGVMKVMAWWPDAVALQLIRTPFAGDPELVRGGSPLPITAATRRNWSTNPNLDVTTGYSAGAGAPTLSIVARTDSIGGQMLRAVNASAGSSAVVLAGTLPGGIDATVAMDLQISAAPSSVTVSVAWTNAAGGSLGSTSSALTAAQSVFSVGQLYRQTFPLTVPAGAAAGTATITVDGMPAAGQIHLDRVTLEAAATDGSYVDGSVLGGQWLGATGLSTSVIAPVVTLLDGECPVDVPVVYQLSNPSLVGGRITSQAATLASNGVTWLTHPALSSVPLAIDLAVKPTLEHDVEQGVFWPLGEDKALTVSAAVRRAPTGSLAFNAMSLAERDALLAKFRDVSPVLLRPPAELGYAQGWWVSLGKLTEDPNGTKAWQDAWILSAPFVTVRTPSALV